jgi:predicted NBD/HSP70 family sugar kinase
MPRFIAARWNLVVSARTFVQVTNNMHRALETMRKIDTQSFVRATRATTRDINRRILLNLVREHQPISRADLARRMRVGRGVVTSLVDELLRDRAIYESTTVDAPRGRKPMMLHVRTHDRLAIAIDIRFSRTFLMLSDFSGATIALQTFDTIVEPDALIADLALRIKRLRTSHRSAGICQGIGVAIPGMVARKTGRVLNAPQLGWRDVDVRDALAKRTGLPVFVESASVACALAQIWLGQRGSETPRDFVYVTVGDGVGSGVVVNGEVVRGHDDTAGEFGHVPLDPRGPRCLCGARGCLETYASNLATLCRYLGHDFSPHDARGRLQQSGLTIEDVIQRAKQGDRGARRALEETACHLGAGLAVIVNALNPARIFVGGEITEVWPQLAPIIQGVVAERALTRAAGATPIVPDPTSMYPRLRGATALVAAPTFAAPQVA